jgi:predicted component of viral defense system (DUF524 family)
VTTESNINFINIDDYNDKFVKPGFSYSISFQMGNDDKVELFCKAVERLENFFQISVRDGKDVFITIRNAESKYKLELLAREFNLEPNFVN